MIKSGSQRIFPEKLGCFHRTSFLSDFVTSTGLFHGIMGTSVKALKKTSCWENVA